MKNAVNNEMTNSKIKNINARHKTKNKLDEMQEQKMLKIEHNACWLAFWGLFISLIVQLFTYRYGSSKIEWSYYAGEWRYVAGEWIVFMCLAIYMGAACIKNGVWDRKLSPTPAVNLCASLIAGIFIAIINAALSYKRYASVSGSAAAGIISGLCCFAMCFMLLTLCTFLYKKRVNKLEKEDFEEDVEEDKYNKD